MSLFVAVMWGNTALGNMSDIHTEDALGGHFVLLHHYPTE